MLSDGPLQKHINPISCPAVPDADDFIKIQADLILKLLYKKLLLRY